MADQTGEATGLTTTPINQIEQNGLPDDAQLIEQHLGPGASRSREIVAGAASLVATATAIGAAYKYGMPVFDAKIVPDVPVVPAVTEGIRQANDTIRTAAPGALIGGLGMQVYFKAKSLVTRNGKGVAEAARQEYRPDARASRRNRFGILGKGLLLAATSATLIAAASGIEDEVSNGPNRPIAAVFGIANKYGNNPTLVAQDELAMFMNESFVSSADIAAVEGAIAEQGGLAAPIDTSFVQVRGGSVNTPGLTLTVTAPVFEAIAGEQAADTDCEQPIPVIADAEVGVETGDQITLNEVPARVVAVTEDITSMNRAGIIAESDSFSRCVEREDPEVSSKFGVLVTGLETSEVKTALTDAELSHLSVLSEEQFTENNRSFWKNNGTPIILQLMTYLGAYAAVAIKSSKRASLEASSRQIGMLDAAGVRAKTLRSVETVRALKESTKAAGVAAVTAPAFAAVINAAEFGLKVGVGLREVAVGYLFTAAAKTFGARRAITRHFKANNTSEVLR